MLTRLTCCSTTFRPIARQSAKTIRQRRYHKRVLDHFNNPRNVGALDKNKKNVGTGLVGAPACGDVLKLQIEVDENGTIVETAFKTFGCGSAIASSSLASQMIKQRSTDDAKTITNQAIASDLNLPPVKLHCSMLAEQAIKAAVKDYENKQDTSCTSCDEATKR